MTKQKQNKRQRRRSNATVLHRIKTAFVDPSGIITPSGIKRSLYVVAYRNWVSEQNLKFKIVIAHLPQYAAVFMRRNTVVRHRQPAVRKT